MVNILISSGHLHGADKGYVPRKIGRGAFEVRRRFHNDGRRWIHEQAFLPVRCRGIASNPPPTPSSYPRTLCRTTHNHTGWLFMIL